MPNSVFTALNSSHTSLLRFSIGPDNYRDAKAHLQTAQKCREGSGACNIYFTFCAYAFEEPGVRFTGNQTPGGATWNVRNSGVMFHSQSAQSVNINQDFPVSVEVQLLGGLDSGARATGNVCTPGTQVMMGGVIKNDHCINSSSKTYNGDQWVSMTVIVLGDSIVHYIVEGDTVLTYENPQIGGGFVGSQHNWTQAQITDSPVWISKAGTLLKEGYIALQAESHPIDFRRIELLNLQGCMDKKAKNYRDYYMKADNSQCEC